MRKLQIGVVTFLHAVAAPSADPQPAKPDRIVIEYAAPSHPAIKQIYELLKSRRALEHGREILFPVQWPSPLKLALQDCGGELYAGYETPSSLSVNCARSKQLVLAGGNKMGS